MPSMVDFWDQRLHALLPNSFIGYVQETGGWLLKYDENFLLEIVHVNWPSLPAGRSQICAMQNKQAIQDQGL